MLLLMNIVVCMQIYTGKKSSSRDMTVPVKAYF